MHDDACCSYICIPCASRILLHHASVGTDQCASITPGRLLWVCIMQRTLQIMQSTLQLPACGTNIETLHWLCSEDFIETCQFPESRRLIPPNCPRRICSRRHASLIPCIHVVHSFARSACCSCYLHCFISFCLIIRNWWWHRWVLAGILHPSNASVPIFRKCCE